MPTINGTSSGETIDDADGVTNGQDIINGKGGIDTIYGLGGDDVIKGGGGADKLYGGSGSDTADYSDSNKGVDASLSAGGATGGTAEGDTYNSIENLNGSKFADTLQGNSGDNKLLGGDGDDILKGAGGNDTLWGGNGNDLLNTDGIGDKIDGGAGIDTVNFIDSNMGISVNLEWGKYAQGPFLQHPHPSPHPQQKSIENVENVQGSNYDDKIVGDTGANVLAGKNGADQIWGGDGHDTVIGGAGADQMHGGDGSDTLSYAGSAGVTINMALGVSDGGDGEGDTFDGFENVKGSDFDDIILGSAEGNLIDGAHGDDIMFGLGGNDIFLFRRDAGGAINTGHDTIGDFTVGQDHILIDNSILANFADLQAHMEQVGTSVVITLGVDDTITLTGSNMASLSASDFFFV